MEVVEQKSGTITLLLTSSDNTCVIHFRTCPPLPLPVREGWSTLHTIFQLHERAIYRSSRFFTLLINRKHSWTFVLRVNEEPIHETFDPKENALYGIGTRCRLQGLSWLLFDLTASIDPPWNFERADTGLTRFCYLFSLSCSTVSTLLLVCLSFQAMLTHF